MVVSPSYTEGVVYAIQLYGVRSIMASTAVCGTASLSSILSVPTIHMGSGQDGYVGGCNPPQTGSTPVLPSIHMGR